MDSTTYDRAAYVIRQARIDGHDPVEALDKAGLLLTAKRKHETDAQVLWDLVTMLETSDLHQWKEQGSAIRSPGDAKSAITARLKEMAHAAMKVGWVR